MTVKPENVQHFLENKNDMLALMRHHVSAMRDCRQEELERFMGIWQDTDWTFYNLCEHSTSADL
jgi:hypothetical protein